MTERRITAYCSRLVERGDILIDNYGESFLAAGPAGRVEFDTGREYVVPVFTDGVCSQLGWKPVDDFRYGKRIERSN